MNYKELKRSFRYEYKVNTGEYLILDLSDNNRTDDLYSFNIQFQLNFKTFLFCSSKIVDRQTDFEIEKIITINNFGFVYEFTNIDDFVDFIEKLENVVEIHKYGQ